MVATHGAPAAPAPHLAPRRLAAYDAQVTGRATHPLERLLEEVIHEEGGTCRATEIRDEVVGVIARVTAEQAATGQEIAAFCHWTILGGVAVFTFIGDDFEVFVVPCPANRQWELVNRFDRMARTEVDAYRARLHARYGKETADLVIKPQIAFDWLFLDNLDAFEEPERTDTAEAEGTAGDGRAAEPALETAEAGPAVESDLTFDGDPMLEQMMAAIRARGGGTGSKPLRISDLD